MARNTRRRVTVVLAILFLGPTGGANAPDVGMFGNTPSRNMTSDETGLPSVWDPETGANVLWSQPVGSQAYGGPTVANGRVFVGTNNEGLRDASIDGDKGVVMAFDAQTGQFLWQMAHDKLPAGQVNDWPLQGICSTPFAEEDRVFYVSNRAEVVCLTADVGEVIWSYDMIAELDVFPHNLATGSPLIVGDIVYTVTGNGVDEGHVNVPSPLAPNFIALDKRTGELVWENAVVGERVLHGHWTNPAYANVNGQEQVIFPGGDGVIYGLDAHTGDIIWQFDCNPKDSKWVLGGRGTRNNILATPVVYDNKVYIGVGQDPEHGEAPGHFWVIDITGTGDVTDTHAVWHRGGEDFYRTLSTAAIRDDIVYISSLSGFLHALDAQTGEHFWTYDTFAAVWGSPFAADGRVYLGDEDGDVAVLRAGKTLEVIGEYNMGAAVYSTPVARDGVLFILSRNRLWALKEGASSSPLRQD